MKMVAAHRKRNRYASSAPATTSMTQTIGDTGCPPKARVKKNPATTRNRTPRNTGLSRPARLGVISTGERTGADVAVPHLKQMSALSSISVWQFLHSIVGSGPGLSARCGSSPNLTRDLGQLDEQTFELTLVGVRLELVLPPPQLSHLVLECVLTLDERQE